MQFSLYRSLRLLTLSVMLLALSAMACPAVESGLNAPSGSGKKKLLLFAKNPSTWAIIKNGAHGKLVYREATGTFTLTASGLQPRTPYALVRYADSPPNGDIVARGRSDENGALELSGIWNTWSRKFWVVAGDDVTGGVGERGTLKAWRPDRYLFEEKPLGIDCFCPEPEEP